MIRFRRGGKGSTGKLLYVDNVYAYKSESTIRNRFPILLLFLFLPKISPMLFLFSANSTKSRDTKMNLA